MSYRNRSRHAAVLVVAIAALSACATAPEASDGWQAQLKSMGWSAGTEVASIANFRLDGFKVLDASHVVIYSGFERRHLLTVRGPCPSLPFAHRLAWRSASGALMRNDRLMMSGLGTTAEADCFIDTIHALEKVIPAT